MYMPLVWIVNVLGYLVCAKMWWAFFMLTHVYRHEFLTCFRCIDKLEECMGHFLLVKHIFISKNDIGGNQSSLKDC